MQTLELYIGDQRATDMALQSLFELTELILKEKEYIGFIWKKKNYIQIGFNDVTALYRIVFVLREKLYCMYSTTGLTIT